MTDDEFDAAQLRACVHLIAEMWSRSGPAAYWRESLWESTLKQATNATERLIDRAAQRATVRLGATND